MKSASVDIFTVTVQAQIANNCSANRSSLLLKQTLAGKPASNKIGEEKPRTPQAGCFNASANFVERNPFFAS
jgi:hypothetical protein